MFLCTYAHIIQYGSEMPDNSNISLFPTRRNRGDISELDGLGIEILFNHERYLKGDSMLKLTQIKAGHLADLIKTVDQGVAVYEKLTRGFGNVEVVLKECLNGLQRFAVERLEAAALEYLLQKHFAKCGGQLIDQAANAKIFVADDVLFVLKYLANLKGYLCLFVCTGKILDVFNNSGDTDCYLRVELGRQCVGNVGCNLFKFLVFGAGLNVLNEYDVVLANADDVIICLVW